MSKPKRSKQNKVIWALVIIGFAIMEFPGIYIINRVEPMIFGMPFIYGFIIIMWAYMCAVLYYAYKVNWGHASKNGDLESEMKGEVTDR